MCLVSAALFCCLLFVYIIGVDIQKFNYIAIY